MEKIKTYKINSRLFFQKCKSVKDSFQSKVHSVTDNKGNFLTNIESLLTYFKTYFEQTLNSVI